MLLCRATGSSSSLSSLRFSQIRRFLPSIITSHRVVPPPLLTAAIPTSSLSFRRSSPLPLPPGFHLSSPFRSAFSAHPFASMSSPAAFGPTTDYTGHIHAVFAAAKAANRPAFVAYTTLGFPTPAATVEVIKSLEESGADIIELGVPFTDPLADGTTIQRANQRALENGVTSLKACIDLARSARAAGVKVPFVFMGYYNPFRSYGEKALMADCREAGVHGFIIVDLPPEESDSFRTLCRENHLSFVPLIAPTTTAQRIQHLVQCADSFIYAVSLTGTTGERSKISDSLPEFIANVKSRTNLPIAIGFGISDNTSYTTVGKLGDGVVVGSAIINTVDRATPEERAAKLKEFCTALTGPNHKPLNVDIPHIQNAKAQDTIKVSTPLGNFGDFGGRYVPETLVAALEELEVQYEKAKNDPSFHAEVRSYWPYIGRPSSLHIADRLTKLAGGATIWLKREDLNHTGAHKINNAIAQAILSKRLGKQRLICETGAGQHGVATATICAKLGIPLTVYMGSEDVARQQLNVFRMQTLGATVVPVDSGSRTLKDAINEAMRDWVTNINTTHYLIGSAIGPHPFPTIVRDFQSVIGSEAREQFMALNNGKLPDAVLACVGGGSNAIGMFYPFRDDASVALIGVEAGGEGADTDKHSATLAAGTPGVLHGTRTYLLQDSKGQILETHSISAGLDYPGVGPEHAYFKSINRAQYVAVTDKQALQGFRYLTEQEGIIPALESSHAIYHAVHYAKTLAKDKHIIICVSGRGDKDMDTVRRLIKDPKYEYHTNSL